LASKNSTGGTLLHSAAEGGMVLLAELALAKGAGIDARDRYGRSPLHLAALWGRTALVEQLLNRGAERDIRTPTGATALDLARSRGHQGLCEWLAGQGIPVRDPKWMDTPGDPYFGQNKPGARAELFAAGIISSPDELEHGIPAWSPDGSEITWSTLGKTYRVRRIDGRWGFPEISPLFERYKAMHVAFSRDGKRIIFDSKSPQDGSTRSTDSDIWFLERRGEGWSGPVNAGPAVNSEKNERAASIASNGTLYFASDYDLYRSVYRDGRYMPREKLGDGINTDHLEIGCLIAPDESFLVFSSSRPRPGGEEGELDSHISFRKSDGSWTPPVAFGREHGVTENFLIGASPDGKFLFFGAGDVQWIDAGIISKLRGG